MNASDIVAAVARQQGIDCGALAKALGCTPSALSFHVGKLEASRQLFSVWDNGKKRLFAPAQPEGSP